MYKSSCILILLLSMPFAAAQELVRIHISEFVGAEPITVNSTTNPSLFTLDPRIESIELTAINPAAPNKQNRGPATYLPALTPESVADPDIGGYIEITITPVTGEVIDYGEITYTTRAQFPSNPSSLQLKTSADGFAATIAVINTNMDRTDSTLLPLPTGDAVAQIRFFADDDFGQNGGGEAGFAVNDLVITGGIDAGPMDAQAIPVGNLPVWLALILVVMLTGFMLIRKA